MKELIIAIIAALSGGLGQYILSNFLFPRKDKREADQQFIETLLQRIANLEGRMDEQSKQLTSVMEENARLKVEMDYLKKENSALKASAERNDERDEW